MNADDCVLIITDSSRCSSPSANDDGNNCLSNTNTVKQLRELHAELEELQNLLKLECEKETEILKQLDAKKTQKAEKELDVKDMSASTNVTQSVGSNELSLNLTLDASGNIQDLQIGESQISGGFSG